MSLEMTFEQLKELMETISKNQLGGLTLEAEGFKLRIDGRRAEKQVVLAGAPAAQTTPAAVPAQPVPVQENPAQAAPAAERGSVVKSPIVGTFYSAPSPDKAPYVAVGSKVKSGDVLFIIESMKLMNEVQSDCAGTVEEILVADGQPVEYGQPILRIV